MTAAMTIGATLRNARKRAGLNLREASYRIGMSKSHLSVIENDDSVPGLLIAARLAALYGISLDALVDETGSAAYAEGKPTAEAAPR